MDRDDNSDYWLFDWLKTYQVTDASRIQGALDSRSLLQEMRRSALEWNGTPSLAKTEYNLIAGSGLGTHTGLTCTNHCCRVNRIDVLFRHAWHYFDHIVLPDAAGDLLRESDGILEDCEVKELFQHIESAMYLRAIGAESLARYYSPNAVIRSSSDAIGGPEWDEIWKELAQSFLKHPERYAFDHLSGNSYRVNYDDPSLEYVPALTLDLKRIPKSQRRSVMRSALAENMARRHRRSLYGDLIAANRLGGSLGSTIWSHEWVLSKIAKDTNEGAVFFQMEFPSLRNVPIADLINLRLEHKESFLACRTALKKAVRELSNSREIDRNSLADEVVRDIIIPETAKLTQKLEAARSVLAKKSAISLTVAGLTTLVGAHFGIGMPASMAAGALAALGTGLKDAASKYSEESRDVEISEMSFLWKALRCGDK